MTRKEDWGNDVGKVEFECLKNYKCGGEELTKFILRCDEDFMMALEEW